MTDLIKPMAEFSVEGPLKSISFDIGSYNVVISESIVVQWIVMLVLGIVFFILGRNLKVRSTSRRQMAAEYLSLIHISLTALSDLSAREM